MNTPSNQTKNSSESSASELPLNPIARIVIKDADPKSRLFARYGRRMEDRAKRSSSPVPYLRYVG